MGKEPARDEADSYDLADEPVKRPAQSSGPPVVPYRSKAVVQREAREQRRQVTQALHLKDLWLPIALAAAGCACKGLLWLSHETGGGTRAAVVMGLVAMATVFNVLIMFAGILLATRVVDLEPGPAAPAIVKLGLIFVAGASAGGFIASLAGFSTIGITTGVNVLFLIYWALFALLFRAGLVETIVSVVVISLLQAVLNVGVWKI